MTLDAFPWPAPLDEQARLAAGFLALLLVVALLAWRVAGVRHRRAQARQLRERLLGRADVARRRAF